MTTEFYSSADAVLSRTGIVPKDLGMADDAALVAFLEDLLAEISDLVNLRMRRNYLQEFDAGDLAALPRGLNGIVADIAAESIRQMVQTRETPVVRVDDFAVRMVTSRVFTPDIAERLKLYGRSAVTVDVATTDVEGESLLGDDLIEILNGS